MRLAESKIKEALLHPDVGVRQLALDYFGQAYRRDADLVPLVQQAVAQYGRRECFLYHSSLGNLTPSAADVAWIAAELQRPEPAGTEGNYDRALIRLLYNADPAWVQPLEADLKRSPRVDAGERCQLEQFLEVAGWDADRCWLELERMCGKPDDEDVDLDFADLIIERLARSERADPQRVLDLLTQPVEDVDDNLMYWMETFAVVLAGELRLEAAVPMIVEKLYGDHMFEECSIALAKIGSAAVATHLTTDFLELDWDCRYYAAGVFESVHDDAMVARCLELLPLEEEVDVRTHIAAGLVRNFAFEGVEPVRALIVGDDYDPSLRDLEGELCAAATLMGVSFPELVEWKQRSDQRRERIVANMRAMESDLDVPFPPMRSDARYFDPEPIPEPEPMQKPAVATTPAGRNDPCPCGSGKKYKKCCLNRQSSVS